MHERHNDIDRVHADSIKDLDGLIRSFQVKHVTYEDVKPHKSQPAKASETIAGKIEQLKRALDEHDKHNKHLKDQVWLFY